MRGPFIALTALVGCGGGPSQPSDAPADSDALPGVPDALPDAGCSRTLLTGGAQVEPQGWSVVMQAPASLTYGADYVRLETSTPTGATTSGQLLLRFPGALPAPPFSLQVVLLVERVDAHNSSDAAVAILGSFTAPFGTTNERSQMIYLDGGKIGWADDTQAFTASITDGAYHTLELALDVNGAAQVKLDGAPALTRSGFATNGTIAIGDQTNEPKVDGAIRIRSVRLLCP